MVLIPSADGFLGLPELCSKIPGQQGSWEGAGFGSFSYILPLVVPIILDAVKLRVGPFGFVGCALMCSLEPARMRLH